MNPTAALPGSMTWMEIRLSSGSRCPQSPKGLPPHLLHRFSVATVPDGWPIQAVFWLEWGSSTAERIPLWFDEQQVNMLRHDYVPVDLKSEAAPHPAPRLTRRFVGLRPW